MSFHVVFYAIYEGGKSSSECEFSVYIFYSYFPRGLLLFGPRERQRDRGVPESAEGKMGEDKREIEDGNVEWSVENL